MTGIKAMDSKINIGMFLNSMAGRFKNFLAAQLTAEEKLARIIEEVGKDVQEKRVLARQIGGQMRAISDPDTKELEPLEAMKTRRVKLVALGGKILNDPEKKAQLGQLQQEINALDAQISSQQNTYDMLAESYELAKNNYQEALNAFETIKRNGPAMIKAIKAHKAALEMRDSTSNQKKIDASFLNELTEELNNSKAELRSDKAIEADLDGMNPTSIDAELAKMDSETIDSGLMAEFQAAAAK
jgi:predicted Zn-dependent protease